MFSDSVMNTFNAWRHKYGVLLDSWVVPYLLLGPVPYKTFPFLAYSLKSMSIGSRHTIDGIADPSALGDIPLWHSAVFKNSRHLSYYSHTTVLCS